MGKCSGYHAVYKYNCYHYYYYVSLQVPLFS